MRPVAILLAMALFYGTSAAWAQDAAKVGSVTAITGAADVVSFKETAIEPLAPGVILFEGDRVTTHAGGRVEIELVDGSLLRLGERSEMKLEWVMHAPDLGRRNVLLEVSTGIVRAVIETVSYLSSVKVRLPTAVTSARGTDWIVEATATTCAVVTLEGVVEVAALDTALGPPVVLGVGEGTSITAGAPPNPASVWAEQRRDRFIARTRVD